VAGKAKAKAKGPDDYRMSFTAHLEELRRRLIICIVALVAGMAVSYAFRDQLFVFILHPLFQARENTARRAGETGVAELPASADELVRDAQRFSKRALENDDPREAARLAARAADLAAKAVQAVEHGEQIRADREREQRFRAIAYTDPIQPFWVSLQLSLVGGFILAFGVILWEIWAFIAPGLYPREKRYAAPFIIAASVCFIGGAGFGYRYVFPIGFGFFTSFSREIADAQGIDMMDVTTVDAFVSLALKLLLAFGIVFELPVVISFLSVLGIVDHRQLWRFARWFTVIDFIIAAILTPPDVISQCMMAFPMLILYFVSIGLAYFLHPDRRRRKPASPDDSPGDGPDDAEGDAPDDEAPREAEDETEPEPVG
jgi:Tat protein translocase TatC